MDVFTCLDHDYRWPVGVASIVVATDEHEAKKLLDEALVAKGLKPSDTKPYTLQRVDTAAPHAVVLLDGEY